MTQLLGALTYNQVNVGVGPQLAGYRTLYPDAMMCPMWTGTDLAGRPVCENSFYTKRAGCNSALDRIKVEDSLRPRYAEFLLDARGIKGVGADYGDSQLSEVHTLTQQLVGERRAAIGVQNGNFGIVTPSTYQYGLSNAYNELASNAFQNIAEDSVAYQDSMANSAQNRRNAQNLITGANMPMQNGSMNRMGTPNTVTNPGSMSGRMTYDQVSQAMMDGLQQPGVSYGTPGYGGPDSVPMIPVRPNIPGEKRRIIPAVPKDHQKGYNPPHQKGFGIPPTPMNLVPPHQKGYNPPHQKGFGIPCNPNTTECTGAWRNDMFVPKQPTTWQNYIPVDDYNNYSGEYI